MLLMSIVSASQPAMAQTKVRFTLDWIPGATHGAFLIALQKGYYKAEGLDVTIDRGKGSAEVVRQLASNVYDMGFPDINVVMDFNSKNPDQAFPVLMSGYEEAPAAIIMLKSSGITEPKQLNGKRLGSAPNDSTFKLFPIFAKQTSIDISTMQIQNIDPSLREVLLVQKKVDAIPGQIFNSLLELKAKGVPASDISYFMYKDYGLELYANSVAASRQFLKEHPDAVKGFIRATIKGLKDMAADPEQCGQGRDRLRALAQSRHRARPASCRTGVLHSDGNGAQEGFWRCRPGTASKDHWADYRRLSAAPEARA
jgi:NitT/TauT family transport system substrate-binding protein